ncbi:MAG: ankyrin repeat domain-containing protein [Pirellulales bacterium]|nr:ankyrin repeat domain-containing protein [Pirellulales bacterium]
MAVPPWLIALIPLVAVLAVVFLAWRYVRRGTGPVHRAVSFGNVERLRELLAAEPKAIHAEDVMGMVPLQYAAYWGQLASARLLLERGANPNGGRARSPLHYAAAEGHRELVELLLDRGAAIDAPNGEDGGTPLHAAVIGRRAEVVRLLLTRGAAVDARTASDWTPCHFAAADGNMDLLAALLDSAADVGVVNAGGQTPLELAHNSGHREAAEYLRGRMGKSE